jgi:hypothetical protein
VVWYQRFEEILNESFPISLAPLTDSLLHFIVTRLRNNQKLISIEFVYEAFIISKMAMTLRFEVMFDSVALLNLGLF